MLGLIGGPLILVRATLILFDVVEPGDATDILAAPEILWETALGLYPLIKGFKTPPAPAAADAHLETGNGGHSAAMATV